MAYKMRFIQSFDKRDAQRFLELEQTFVRLEQSSPELRNGRRFIPVTGREPSNTLIWEAEFDSTEDCVQMLRSIEQSDEHTALLDEQIRYMRDAYVEIYREITTEE